jgi:hypothetical protein
MPLMKPYYTQNILSLFDIISQKRLILPLLQNKKLKEANFATKTQRLKESQSLEQDHCSLYLALGSVNK